MAEPSANLRVRISADLADIRQGLGVLTRQLREVRTEAARPLPPKNGISDVGVSAGQTAQALRQLPAQFTDIFTSLQGGMPFFTVLVQQGGQIKDSFGGVEPALKGVSSALLGMVNPYTVAAAAVGLLVFAWYDAEKQAEAYTKALGLSRNEAAVTTLTLVTLAERTSEAMKVTASSGAEVAQAIGSNGRIAAQNMQAVAAAAVAMQEITGQAVGDTVALYGKLAEDPVRNAQKLNEQVNFMTTALYEQIRALQEQGRNQDAATVITRAAADETVMALAKVRASQNPVIRGFQDLWAEATKAWKAMQATAGFAPQAEQMQRMLADNRRDLARLNAIQESDNPMARNPHVIAALEKDVKERSAKIKAIAVDLIKERKDAEIEAAETAAVETMRHQDDIIDAQLTKQEKRDREVAAVRTQSKIAIDKANAAGLINVAAELAEKRDKALAALDKKYEEKPTAGLAGASRSAGLQGYKDDLTTEMAAIESQTQVLRAQYAARQVSAEEYYQRLRELMQEGSAAQEASLVGQIDYLKKQSVAGKDAVTVGRQLGELEARLNKLRTESAAKLQMVGIEEAKVADTRRALLKTYSDALQASNAAYATQLTTMVERVGMGERQYEVQQRINDALAVEADRISDLEKQRTAKEISDLEFAERKAMAEAATLDRLQDIRHAYDELRQAEGSWLSGAGAAWENYKQQAGNVAQQIGDTMTSTIGGFEDAWVQFTTTGKASFSDLTKSVLADLARIAFRQAVLGIVNAVASAWGGGGVTSAGNQAVTTGTSSINNQLFQRMQTGGGYSSGGYTGDGGVSEPAGVVHKGEVVWSQADIARAGGVGIVEAMRKGLRGYDGGGAVGVTAPAMGGGTNIFQTRIEVPSGGGAEESTAASAATAHEVKKSFESMANEWARTQMKPRGVLWAMRNGG